MLSVTVLIKIVFAKVKNDFGSTLNVNSNEAFNGRVSDSSACSLSSRVERNDLEYSVFFLSYDFVSVDMGFH